MGTKKHNFLWLKKVVYRISLCLHQRELSPKVLEADPKLEVGEIIVDSFRNAGDIILIEYLQKGIIIINEYFPNLLKWLKDYIEK